MNNQLEYVYIKSFSPDRNMVHSMALSKGISDLRFLCIYQYKAKYELKLNINAEFPAYLTVFDINSNIK